MADLKPWERDWNSEQSDSAPAPEAAKPWERDWTESASDTPARVNAMQAVGRNPAAVAEADKLARRHGVPVGVAERNADELKRRSAAEEAADLAMSNPLTARWLGADPDNAAVAGGDWGTLKALETLFKFSPIGMLDSAVRASGAPRSAASGVISMLGSGVKGAGEQVKALERKMTGGVQIKRTEGEQRLREAFGLDVNLIDLTKKSTDTVGDTLKSAGQALAVPDAEKTFVDKFFEAAGTTVAGLGVSYINPMAGMALWSGAGADVQAERARAAGTYETENADTATLIGGQVTAITERIGYGWLMRALPAGAKKALLSRFGDLLLGGAGEAAQEVTENATQDTVTQALVDPSQQIGNYGEEGAIGFTVGLLFRGAGQIAKSGADARDAVAERDALTGMIDATQASSLFKTSPARFKDAVSQLKSQGMTDVYVPVEAWQTLFQSDADASDSARVAAGVSDADYAEALLSGGRIRVPVEGFLTELTAEQQTALAKDSRFKPGGFSPVDAASFDPDEAVTEYFKTAGVGRPSGVVTDVYNEYVSRLTGPYERGDAEYLAEFVSALTAGYGSRSGMQQEIADLWINNLSVAAEGRIPERLRKVLGERKDVVPEIDSVLDALRAGAYPKDADVFGPTLAEAVRSWGGVDPESFGAPDLRSQDAQRVGVLRKGGLMMEYALERAVEQGYLPEGSDLSDFLASMTQDMQGVNPVYSAANLNAEKQARSGVMDQAAEELRERGIDLSKVSNSEARRLMGMQSARGSVTDALQEFDQSPLGSATTVTVDGVERPALNSNGVPIHDTVEGVRNFWRWFGDSKVVDAEGRPLVVYHGTPEAGGIESFATSNGGIYLSSNEKVASGYTAKRGMWLGESTGVVVDGFAALKNPLIIDAAGKRHDNIPVPWQEWKPKVYGNLPIGAVSIRSAAAYAKANGYDGLIVNNTIDTADIKDTKKSSVYVAFNPGQVKSATGNNGDFSPDDARILYQSKPTEAELNDQDQRWYFSAVAQAVTSSKTTKASGGQWLATLKNTPGVKPDEIEWLGLPEFLGDRKGVTREEIEAYVRSREVVVEETILGKQDSAAIIRAAFAAEGWGLEFDPMTPIEEQEAMFTDPDGEEVDDFSDLPELLQRVVLENTTHSGVHVDAPQYENMTLPGGKNYRELLLRFPSDKARGLTDDEIAQINRVLVNENGYSALGAEQVEILKAGGNEAVSLLEDMDARVVGVGSVINKIKNGDTFTHTHFHDANNYFAHVRFDDRVDADGNRVLFLLELQSDWHKQAAKYGYKNNKPVIYPSAEKMAEFIKWTVEPSTAKSIQGYGLTGANPDDFNFIKYPDGSNAVYRKDQTDQVVKREFQIKLGERLIKPQGEMSDAEWAALIALDRAIKQELFPGMSVPDAPFKKSWYEVLIKRMVRYAAENGYHSLALPRPDQVPVIEQWGVSYDVIKADPNHKYASIVGRYEEEYVRTIKALAKKYGGESGGSDIFAARQAITDNFTDLFKEHLVKVAIYKGYKITDALKLYEKAESFMADVAETDMTDGTMRGIMEFWPEMLADSGDDADVEIGEIYSAAYRDVLDDARFNENMVAPDLFGSKNPSIVITPRLRMAAMSGLPLFQRNTQDKKRGSLSIMPDESWVMNLLRARDWSTFLHESSHVQLEIMRQVDAKLRAADELTAEQRGVLADHDALLKWMGSDTFSDVTVEMHEQFAETFEAYLREGKAPSPGLQSVFRKFSAWLKAVYFTISKLPNAKLNDDIRSVMDRMLATDAEITEAQKEQGLDGALLAIEGYDLTDDERERMAEAVRLAHEVAVEQEFKRQYAYEKREQQAWYRAERQRIRGEVAEELNADPVYQAAALMRRGTMPDGSPRTDGLTKVRMDSDTLLTMYGNEFIKRNLSGMYGKEGSPPDAIAALFGFDSGRAMIDALANQQPYGAFLKAETERRLTEQYPDPMTDNDAVDRAALAANNEFSDRIVMEEIRRTEARVGDGRPTQLQVMKEAARRIVAVTRIMDLKPHKHRDSERRLGREALEAAVKGDFAEVLRLKRQQLMASLLFRQASEAQDTSEKQFKHAQGLAKKPAQDRLAKAAADYLEQINAILSAFEFRRATNKEISRRRKLSAWVDERQAAGDVTAVSEELLARVEAQATKNWREATVQEMNDAYEAMRNIEHLAGLKNKLLKARRAAGRDEAVDEMLARVEQTLPDVVADVVDDADLTVAQRAAKRVRAAMDDLTRPETIIEILDGGESGPFHDFIHYAQVQAESAKNALRRRVADQLKAMHAGLSDEFWTSMDSKVVVNGVSTTRYTLLAAVMNMGNAGNRQRLRDGGFSTSSGSSVRLTDAQVDALPSMLTAAELQYVQGLWDVAESMRPDIEALQQRMAGIPINFVEAVPLSVTSSDGVAVSMRGGYWPIAYHSDRSAVGERQAGDDALQIMMGMGVSRAATSKGYTKDRVEEFSAPLRLNLGLVLAKNIDEVMTDVAYREAVRDVQGLLNDQRLKSAVISRLGKSAYNSLRGSLAYSVSGSADAVGMAAQNWRDFTDFMMANASVAALAIRPDIALGNYTSAVVQGLSRVERRAMMRGLRELWLNRGDMTAEIKGLSPFMADRLDDLDAHYAKQITRTQNSRGFRAAYFRVMMTLHRMADHDVTRAVWYGRYTQERAAGADQAEAVRIADKTIRTTQTASGRKDLGTYERDTAFKQTRMFMGPMFVIFGQVRNVAGGSGVAGSAGARIALGLNALFFAPAMFALMAGRWPDDDDDEGLDAGDWVEWLSVNCGPMFALQTMPIVREVAGAIEAAVSGKPVNPRAAPTSQAAATMVKSTKSLWAQGKDIADGEEADYTKLTADLLGVTAPLSGLPASQYRKSSKAIQWLMDNPEASAEQMAAVMLYGPPRE